MNILITGAYGFVGTNISNVLKEEYTLWALDIIEHPSKSYSRFFSWNELDTIPWNDIDTVIHLAGKAHDTKKLTNNNIYFDINTELTKRVFDKFLASKTVQFFFFSSTKAVVDKVMNEVLTEDTSPHPVGPYGISKIAAEEYIQKYGAHCMEENSNKKIYIFRPCMIHGPGNKGNLNLLYNVVTKGIPWPLGAFENKKSFLSIDNLTYIIKQFLLQNPNSGVFHLADDEPISTIELIKLIALSKKRKPKILKINRSLIAFIAKIGTVCKLPLNSERLQKLTESYVVSNLKLKTTIGVERLPVKVDEGLMLTLKSLDRKSL